MEPLPARTERPRPARGVLVLVAVVAIGGLVRDAIQLVPWRKSVETRRIDDEFAELIRALPPDRELGIVVDEPVDLNATYRHARWALAPRVLHPELSDPGVRYVIAALSDPAKVEELCRQRGLRRVAAFNGNALLLLAREGS